MACSQPLGLVIDNHNNIWIASGNYDNNRYVTPHGAGRLVNNRFFEKNIKFYPEKIGYESFILHLTRKDGYDYTVVTDAKFSHTRELGIDHRFSEWGQSMRALGYHPLFVLTRCIIYFIKDKPIGRMGPVIMLYKYLTYRPKKVVYFSLYQKEIKDYIRNTQLSHLKKIIKKLNLTPVGKMIEKLSFSNLRTMKT